MESQPTKPVALVRIPLTVPAGQAASFPKHVESICTPHAVRVRTTAETGRTATMFIFELRGDPDALRLAQGKVNLLISTITLTPVTVSRTKRYVVGALSFAFGVGAILLLFSLSGRP